MDASRDSAEEQAGRPWRGEFRAMMALAWPLILASLTQQVIHSTDIILMGRLGEVALAATTLALNFAFVFNVVLLGLLLASSPMMATALGHRSNAVRDVRRTFRAGLWLLIIAMPPYWLLLWNLAPIMLALGQSAELAESGQTFIRAYMWCTAPWLLFQLLRNFVAALERPRIVLWLSLAAIVVNALLGWSLIFGHFGLPALGIVGGGLGSTITWTFACVALILLIRRDRQFRRFHLFGRWWRFDRERSLAMSRLGWPIGLSLALEVGVFAMAAYFMGWIGTSAVAAHAVAIQFAALTFMVPVGISQAATVRVGRALGAGDTDGLGRAGWTAWTIGIVFMAAAALGMWIYPHEIVALFLGPSASAETRGLAVTFLGVAAAFQIVDGAQVISAGMLRGLHDTRWPLIYAAVGYWVVGLGIAVWLGFGLDWKGLGIWIGLASGLAAVAVLMLFRWIRRERLGLTRLQHA
ncbi:MAG TPA: MATE family efflux transporter [Sphingomicrobium sp.]|jgi:MATE family multidrug resistance protein